MSEFPFPDRAPGGRGRPWNKHSLEVVERLEASMQRARITKNFSRGEMVWTCPQTKQTMFIDFPLSFRPSEVLADITLRDVDHSHRPFETIFYEGRLP